MLVEYTRFYACCADSLWYESKNEQRGLIFEYQWTSFAREKQNTENTTTAAPSSGVNSIIVLRGVMYLTTKKCKFTTRSDFSFVSGAPVARNACSVVRSHCKNRPYSRCTRK